jgi:SAM-dependent methyltransferase
VSASAEWFRDWFGETYLSLYPHRDEAEAEAGVRLFTRESGPESGARVLDLACGYGRHLEKLHDAGYQAVGLDLSARLLRDAAKRPGVAGSLVRGDMRYLPFRDGAFDALVNFFTSFGYFASEEEDELVVRQMRRVLRPGGTFLLDYMNAPWVIANLEAETDVEQGGRRVRQRRWIEEGQVIKRIEIFPSGEDGVRVAGAPQVFHERVRLYDPEELMVLLANNGLAVRTRFGGYAGAPFDPQSPRLLLAGVAA